MQLIWQPPWDWIWEEEAGSTLCWANTVQEESACTSQSSHSTTAKEHISMEARETQYQVPWNSEYKPQFLLSLSQLEKI